MDLYLDGVRIGQARSGAAVVLPPANCASMR